MQKTFILCLNFLVVLTVFTNAFAGADDIVRKENSSKAAVKLKAGKLLEFELKGVKWRFHWCPAGSFTMGSPTSEKSRYDSETQHRVTLTQGFWMGETEVTQKQWQAVMGKNPSHFKGDNLPVEQVSWNDCQEFVQKLNELLVTLRIDTDTVDSGYRFSLPTEAQWEYACRAGSATAYYFGDGVNFLSSYAWYDKNANGRTHPVATKRPNACGLYDMCGNVFEWCQDWYGKYGDGTIVDPRGASFGSDRVNRGGWWLGNAGYCRSACRVNNSPEFRGYGLGLRLCLVPSKLPLSEPQMANVPKPSLDISEIDNKNETQQENAATSQQMPLVSNQRAGKLLEFELKGVLEFELKGVKWRFHWCPAGSFTMGSPTSEKSRYGSETQHRVTLTQGFWMGETEVTQEQWQVLMDNNPSYFKGGNLPVEQVSWDDCQEFAQKLNELLVTSRIDAVAPGYRFSLPTEAQWEYACRAGSTTAYCFGDDVDSLADYAWYNENSDKTTHPVGMKKPNAWGLYDMHANVYEWCQDWYGDNNDVAVVNPTGALSGRSRVLRGGVWSDNAEICRSAYPAVNPQVPAPGATTRRFAGRLTVTPTCRGYGTPVWACVCASCRTNNGNRRHSRRLSRADLIREPETVYEPDCVSPAFTRCSTDV